MSWLKPSWQALAAVAFCAAAVVIGTTAMGVAIAAARPEFSVGYAWMTVYAAVAVLLVAALLSMLRLSLALEALSLFAGAHIAAWLLVHHVTAHGGAARIAFFLLLAASWLLAWRCVTVLCEIKPRSPALSAFSGCWSRHFSARGS